MSEAALVHVISQEERSDEQGFVRYTTAWQRGGYRR